MIEVLSGGFFSSVQDLGRFGWAHLGVSAGGAADAQALKLGNRIIGNQDGAAAIEMTYVGGNFRFSHDTWVTVSGGVCEVLVDGVPMAMWYGFRIKRGQTLAIGGISTGARAYLCVHGGIDVPAVLGSRSTFLAGCFGGHRGRALAGGDRLLIGQSIARSPASRRVGLYLRVLYREHPVLRVTLGPQSKWFDQDQLKLFFESEFEVTTEADRKGLRLKGPVVAPPKDRELITEGVSNGAIQIPRSGQPLILFCEQQTTGGYPKIANVIRADIFRLGQLRAGDKIRFEEVSLVEARRANREREELCRTLLI